MAYYIKNNFFIFHFQVLTCLLALIVSVSCTGFGFGGPGAGFSAFAGLGKSKGFGPFGGGPPFPYAYPFPIPFAPIPASPPQTHIIKVIHEHVNAPSPSKVVKVVHQHQPVSFTGLHEQVKFIGEEPWGNGGDIQILPGDGIFPLQSGPPGHPISLGSPGSLDSGLQILEGSSLPDGHHIVD